ncbi:oxygen-independent coproporphyrinogen III oxidase [Chitinophagaceae bacterium LB-8]|uniref:Coproporphyrinogen-III oxidase n=1 Tax=Paraflavisolibacter caeni TaxID=2982496 RepID=A0A9X2XVR4_9BACT|nr:oxygen-independent coproporphyrinogen III oxidase [Paraflavisolibacter caeni]MCU7549492.1 oxygen-independent coproporphyrinogen III oxidase [Paraflavisolibacter caeni]
MQNEEVNPLLIRKYNQPVPRYTSYPTVPFWKEELVAEDWINVFRKRFDEQNAIGGISLYIHLPFCESLCTYCGCNKKITKNHSVEEEYLGVLEKEWKLYRKLMNQTPVIREVHLGGGTPTFFSPANLQRLMGILLKDSIVHPHHEFSVEGHPNNTTVEHLKVLYAQGFRRISFGVQDNDPEVQRVINRIQPIENLIKATENARRIGFTSINYDLIYGLPLQTLESIERTIRQVLELKPDRIAFYSYAHVPWTSKAQRLFDESHLPSAADKIQLYLKGKQMLMANGYSDIGMDHFALPHDDLYKARLDGRLHRNFMGYTTQQTGLLLGLGVSSISDAGVAYVQNEKTIHDYYKRINEKRLAIKRGYLLNAEDAAFRKYILDISCRAATRFEPEHLPLLRQYTFPKLEALAADGLIEWNEDGVQLTAQGHYFIRNVCSAFDLYLLRNEMNTEKQLFSKAI